MMKNKKILLMLVILLAFLTACSGAPIPQAPTPTAVETPLPTIALKPCRVAGISGQCGTLPVYENRETQTGRLISLNISMIKSNDPQGATDPIFYITGGPGYATTQDYGMIGWFNSILPDHDLVLIDQRGTGGSHEVMPPEPPDWSGLNPDELEKAYADWIQQELPKLDMDPRYYTTSVAVDDLDEIRQVLGYDKINLVGASYGTIAAQYYLRQYEQHVRSIVLISGALTDIPVWNLYAANAQQALDAMFSRCENEPDCKSAFPDVRDEFAKLLEKLSNQPATINNGSYTLSADLFAAEVEFMMRDATQVAKLPRLIHRAYSLDDWSAFGAQAGVDAWKPTMMSYSIQCSENWSVISPEETARLGQGSYFLGWWYSNVTSYALVCKYLPHGITPEGTSGQPHSDVPVLLFNGEFDPLMPPQNVAGAKEIWPNSLALTLPWRSHSLSDNASNDCVGQITSAFVGEGSTKNLPTDCLLELSPIAFETRQ